MSFDMLMARVVGARILGDDTLKRPWDEFRNIGDTNVLSSQCGNAQAIPDTEQAALYYCLTYQKSHYDAVAAAIQRGVDAKTSLLGRWLVVDFGAGPGTALLAWASHVKGVTNAALETSYVHIDNLQCMFNVCERYFREDDNIKCGIKYWREPGLTATPFKVFQ